VFRYGLLFRNRRYIEFETLEKQRLSYIRNIKTAINYFFTNVSYIIYPYFSSEKHWDMPNNGIFYYKDVASMERYAMHKTAFCTSTVIAHYFNVLFDLTGADAGRQAQRSHHLHPVQERLQGQALALRQLQGLSYIVLHKLHGQALALHHLQSQALFLLSSRPSSSST
jgi:hypothetical protein